MDEHSLRLLAVRLQSLNSLSGAHEVRTTITAAATLVPSPAPDGSDGHPW